MLRPTTDLLRMKLALALLATAALAQEPEVPRSRPGGPPPGSPPSLPEGISREQMWPAPTAADWQRPVQITFQRNWEDAVTVAHETAKPILICINMDGEIASEHYAGIRYRALDIAALYEPYVCVIASVYRHNPRDHDEHGNRILCPRFGSVTCGEHIDIEPVLYEKYMDGQRIAPRHIMVELDGNETYDVFFAWDTDSVFTTLRDGIANRQVTVPPVVRGDRPIVERVDSRDIQDRIAVENAYRQGDRELRRQLLEAAAAHPQAAPVELLRLAVTGLDHDLARSARAALAKIDATSAVDLIAEALRAPADADERESLITALEKIGARSPRARMFASVRRGLATQSKDVDVERWSTAISGGAAYAPAGRSTIEARIDASAATSAAKPDDAQARLELAEASLALAVDPDTQRGLSADRRTANAYARMMFEDARRAALAAQQHGAKGWRVEAVLALTAFYLGDTEAADSHAIAAMRDMPADPQDWNAVATLALFAKARQRAIWKALREKSDWPTEWVTDVNAAYSVLARHPLGTDEQAIAHYDFLDGLGAKERASRILDEALVRFPESWLLHDRLRQRILDERGADALEPTYQAMLDAPGAPANLEWFAGYAAIVTAEFHRRGGATDAAIAAYDRAIAHYERAVAANPDNRANSDHYVALALAAKARLALERDALEPAVDHLLAGIERCPEATASLDGLNISPADTARLLAAKLRQFERTELAARLQTALDALDPALLELPAYERVPDDRSQRGPRGRRRR